MYTYMYMYIYIYMHTYAALQGETGKHRHGREVIDGTLMTEGLRAPLPILKAMSFGLRSARSFRVAVTGAHQVGRARQTGAS